MLVLRVFSMILMLVLNGCLTRWMLPAEVASYLAGMNVLIFISILGMAGINHSMLRLIAGKKNREQSNRSLMWRCWLSAAGFTLLVTAVFVILLQTRFGTWINIHPEIVGSVLLCSVLLSVHKLLAASLRSVHALSSSGILEGRSGGPLSNTMYFIVLLAGFSAGLTASTALKTFAVAMAVTAPIGYWMLRKSLRVQEAQTTKDSGENTGGVDSQNIFVFTLPFLLAQVLTYFATEFDVLLANAYTTPDDTALFGIARRLMLQIFAPMQILTVSMASTIAELFAKGERQKLQSALRYSATIGCMAILPLLIVCVVFPEFILETIFGEFYRGAANVFVILTIGQAFNCATGQCANLLMLSGRTSIVLTIKIISALCMVIVGAIVVQRFGITGLAFATATTIAMENITMWLTARKLTGYWTHPVFQRQTFTKDW